MKYRTTKKETMNGYGDVISVSYCALQRLLNLEQPCAYVAGNDGWRADVYAFGNTAIVTGYSSFGNLKASHDLCMRYEDKAMKVRDKYYADYPKLKKGLDKLIVEFIEEVKGGAA